MNDKFFTLALKAMHFHGAVDEDTELNLSNSELQKFAELIVKECAQVASDYDGACYVGTAIEQHFGVEA
jgi:hypothetical protein